ncbi:MAG: EI24 domain-containing protein [Paracoccaceae bacterium]|jgi:uncharacterized protein involved in cysteine biosynthesis|nr:EI24 domain-containing protein [Paracoccaceae bacterium]
MILQSFFLAWADVFRPRALKVLGLGVALSLGLFLAMYFGLVSLIGAFTPDTFTLPWIGEITWLHSAVSIASLGVMLVASVFLMVPVASLFTGFFLEDVAEVVEEAHYPTLPPVRKLTLAESFGDTLRFLGVILGANLLALMIYPFVIPFAPLLFFGLNGYLLGREYFQMAAFRRMHRDEALALYARNRATIWTAGALMAVPLSIPLVNLLVPVLGAATFTHIFHRITRG